LLNMRFEVLMRLMSKILAIPTYCCLVNFEFISDLPLTITLDKQLLDFVPSPFYHFSSLVAITTRRQAFDYIVIINSAFSFMHL
jgi:hypothetical protein